jgi:hypothetical protein
MAIIVAFRGTQSALKMQKLAELVLVYEEHIAQSCEEHAGLIGTGTDYSFVDDQYDEVEARADNFGVLDRLGLCAQIIRLANEFDLYHVNENICDIFGTIEAIKEDMADAIWPHISEESGLNKGDLKELMLILKSAVFEGSHISP